jgi:alkylated DNA repair dioxygenase AlkB
MRLAVRDVYACRSSFAPGLLIIQTGFGANNLNTQDLFSSDQPRRITMPFADVSLWPALVTGSEQDDCLAELIEQTPWRQDSITLFGKTHLQPRLAAWYGDEGAAYTYSGLTLQPLPWTPLLLSLKQRVEDLCASRFNSVLLNYYRDHRDAMGMHADDEPELGRRPDIASLSLGEVRTLVFKHKRDKSLNPVRVPLPPGSLLLMRGETQAHWKHGINRQARPCGPRVNLTFRRIRR